MLLFDFQASFRRFIRITRWSTQLVTSSSSSCRVSCKDAPSQALSLPAHLMLYSELVKRFFLDGPLVCLVRVLTMSAAPLGTYQAFGPLLAFFKIVGKASNLQLNASKTVIVPLGMPFSEPLAAAIQLYTSSLFPSWASCLVKPIGKYLGVTLGPCAGEVSWNEAWANFPDRVQITASSKAGPTIPAYTYNTRCIPTLSYIAQLQPIPPEFLFRERSLLHRLSHMSSTFPTEDFMSCGEMGGPKLASLKVLSVSSLVRSSSFHSNRKNPKTDLEWKPLLAELRHHCDTHLQIARSGLNILWPEFWNHPAFVSVLSDASNNIFDCKLTRAAVSMAQLLLSKDLGLKMQKTVSKELKIHFFKSDWIQRLAPKLGSIQPDLEISVSLEKIRFQCELKV